MADPEPPKDIAPLFSSSATMSWKVSDKLLLAQAVHHLGESPPNWVNVSNLMLAHPLVKTSGRLKAAQDAGTTLVRVFGSRECERTWTALMRSNNLVIGEEEEVVGSVIVPKQRPKEARGLPPKVDRKSQLILAQILYAERMEELRDSIKKKEEEFKALIAKIDHLKSSEADAQLEDEAKELPSPAVQTVGSTQGAVNGTGASPSAGPEASSSALAPSSPTSMRARARTGRGRAPTTPLETMTASASKAAEAADDTLSTPQEVDGRLEREQQTEAVGVEAALGKTRSSDEGQRNADSADEIAADSLHRSKRERSAVSTDPTDGLEEHEAAGYTTQGHTRESKRMRPSAKTGVTATNEEEDSTPPVSTKKSRPAPMQRRSRRGEATAEQEEDAAEESSDVAEAPLRSRTTTRRSARQSREASAAEEPTINDEDNEISSKDSGNPAYEGTTFSARASKREAHRRASSSARHSVDSGKDRDNQTAKERDKEREKRRKANEKLLLQIWTEVSAHTHGNLFQSEVKGSDAPDYHGLIRRPTSLKTIKAHIKEGEISTATQLRRAFNHLFANAMMYNRPGSEVNRMAKEMRQAMESVIDRFEETRNFSARR